MKDKIKILLVCILVVIFFIPLFNGGSSELSGGNIETVSMVKSMGLDKKNGYTLTFTENVVSKNDSSKQKALVSQGDSYASSFDKAQTLTHKQITLSYVRHFVFGEDTAEEGLMDEMDFLCRANELQFAVSVYVCEGKAEDFLKFLSDNEEETDELLKNLDVAGSETGYYSEASLLDLLQAQAEGRNTVVPVIGLNKEEKCIEFKGYGIIENGKLTKRLTLGESRGYNMASGRIMQTIIQTSSASFKTFDFTNKIKVDVKNKKLKRVEISVKCTSDFREVKENEDIKTYEFEKAEKELEQIVIDEINALIVSAGNADILNLKHFAQKKVGSKDVEIVPGEYEIVIKSENNIARTYDLVEI